MLCPACFMGYTWECILGCKEKRIPIEETKEHGGQTKSRDKVKDLESTGRKRAAEMYPIKEGMLCEWTRLRYAGGGIIPIIGCSGNVPLTLKLIWNNGQQEVTGEAIYDSHFCNLN